MSEIPAKATSSEDTSGGTAARDAAGPLRAETWQSSPPGSIYDYIRVASFSIGPDGLIDQWSRRAAQLFGVRAQEAVGKDPIEAFVSTELRERGHRKVAEILDGREWTGLVPYRMRRRAAPRGSPRSM